MFRPYLSLSAYSLDIGDKFGIPNILSHVDARLTRNHEDRDEIAKVVNGHRPLLNTIPRHVAHRDQAVERRAHL